MKKFIHKLDLFERNVDNWFLIIVLFIFSLLRIPSLIEPYWYGDEGIYEVLGMGIRRGRILYEGILDNKPPILYLIYALFDGDLFYAKLLSLIFGLFAIIFIYKLSSILFKTKLPIYLSVAVFALFFGLPIIEGNIANAENFMLAPIILSGIFIFQGIKTGNLRYYVFSGLLLSFAFLIKIVAVFDFLAILIFALIIKYHNHNFSFLEIKKYIKKMIKNKILLLNNYKNEVTFIIAFFFPIILSFLYFLLIGAFPEYVSAMFSQNVGYVGWGNYFLFPMGLLFLKLLILFIVLTVIIIKRKKISREGIFILIWLSFSIFNTLFASRTYPHYLLVLLPSLSLFLAYILSNKKALNINLIIFFFVTVLIVNNFNVYSKSVAYYKNYTDFILGNKNVTSYQAFFDKNTPRDYDIANFIKANTKEDDYVFLWGDSAQIYALSNKIPPGKYTVAYHINFYRTAIEETKKDIDQKKPKYIIITKNSSSISHILENYNLKYDINQTKIYERKSSKI